MLWDPVSTKKDGEEEEGDGVPVTPILVPMQSEATGVEKNVPLLVPDVQDLKDQFQQQQNMLTQIKETLKQNESQLNSKGKQVEVYANKLSQIRARTKNTHGKKQITALTDTANPASKPLVKRSSKENLAKSENASEQDKLPGNTSKIGRKGKISELKKCLEENKIKFEQRTGKEQTETKMIETLVEQMKTKLDERDKTIQDLQKTIEQNINLPKLESRKSKQKSDSVASKSIQTQLKFDESAEMIALQNKIYELEANILDLQENLKEKESVIEARTQAVMLLSQDMSLKGKNTLESLEETRQEMRTMQNNFVVIENQLRNDVSERDNKLIDFEEKYKDLQSTNLDLGVKNAELQEKLIKLQERYADMEMEKNSQRELPSQQSQQFNGKLDELQKKVTELTKELDDRNKAMIKMKIEHKNKLKILNKTVETLKGTSDEKAEIVRLSKLVQDYESIKIGLENRVTVLEDEKGNLLLSVLDVDDLKATEKKLKDQINELEIVIQRQSEDLSIYFDKISDLEKKISDLTKTNQEQNATIENFYAKMLNVEDVTSDANGENNSTKSKEELSRKLEDMEIEYNRRLEELKLQHGKEIEMLESYYNGKMENFERRELEEYRISTEINNIHVEEQIELLIREKQQLLEKLKSLSGVSSLDSMSFEKMERSELRDDKEPTPQIGEEVDSILREENENRLIHLQRIVNDQQNLICDLQKTIQEEKEKVNIYEDKVREMSDAIKELEESNALIKEQIKAADAGESGKNQKSNVNAKNKVKKIEMELVQTKKAVEEQAKKIEDLNEKLAEKDELITKYTERIELFEKDDWDRQNHWQNAEDDFENVQELQKKCLSLENSLIELNEHCERLRKENIEVVHLLSEEKVKRRKLLEELHRKSDDKQKSDEEFESTAFREKVNSLNQLVTNLDTKVEQLETTLSKQPSLDRIGQVTDDGEENWGLEDLQQKLEWTNVVLTSKETEIFRLQNLLEDKSKMLEDYETDVNEYKAKLSENEKDLNVLKETLKVRENQVLEMSKSIDEMQQSANGTATEKEMQLKQLMEVLKQMEAEILRKDSQVQELQDILTQKNTDIVHLKNHLEGVNIELTKNFQEQLEKMDRCLKEKESAFEELLRVKDNLVGEREQIQNQIQGITTEKGKLQQGLLEKDNVIMELSEKLKNLEASAVTGKTSSQDMEDMKIKMKKLAANLKKKAQNETDLLQKVKDLETCVANKDKLIEKLSGDVSEASEKWTLEKSEKEQCANELTTVLSHKLTLEKRCANLEKDLENMRIIHEDQIKQLQEEIQNVSQMCLDYQTIEQQYKDKISDLNKKLNELSIEYQSVVSKQKENESAIEEERKAKEAGLQKLGEVTGKYEEMKFRHDQILLVKSDIENKLEALQKAHEGSATDKSLFDAKIQENLAVIENLESELTKVQDHVKYVEEKLFVSEERRMSLENKNEEMCRKITEDSESLMTIDDLANRVDELLKSEKDLLGSVKTLEASNAELKVAVADAQSAKQSLDNEVKQLTEKIAGMMDELKRSRDVEAEKNSVINNLTKEIEKTKLENSKIVEEYKKLNQDYEQFEVDFKESLENYQNTEKSLKHRIEELTNENSILTDKVNFLADNKTREAEISEQGGEEDKKSRKKKSVTFRTDEAEYIKDLKKQLHSYAADLEEANKEIEKLKGELLVETLKGEVSHVVAEAEEKAESLKGSISQEVFPVVETVIQKSQAKGLAAGVPEEKERKFDASVFFGAPSSGSSQMNESQSFFDEEPKGQPYENIQGSEFDSLMWDDGWGADGHLEEEYLSTRVVGDTGSNPEGQQHSEKIKSLESEIEIMKGEVERLTKELQDQTAKYTKALKKLKEQKVTCEKLQVEMNKLRNNDGLGDLNAAIMDELKCQIENMEKKEREYLKNLESNKLEKESLLKKIDVLSAGNDKFLEMKERQDNDIEIWQQKNNELLKEIALLRQQQSQPPQVLDDSALATENQNLLNKLEALEWKNCELTQLLEEREEMLEAQANPSGPTHVGHAPEDKSLLQKEIEELKNVKALLERKLIDEETKNVTTVEQLTALAAENETLQDILGEIKSKESTKSESKVLSLNQKIAELEELLKMKDGEIHQIRNFVTELDGELTGQKQRVMELESERNVEGTKHRENLVKMEGVLQQREQELHALQEKLKEREEELMRENMLRLENQTQPISLEISKFEAIDLNQGLTQTLSVSEEHPEILKQRIRDLENELRLKEEAMRMQSTLVEESGKKIDDLQQRNLQLEDIQLARFKEEEMQQFRSTAWSQNEVNQVDDMRRKINDLEEILRFKENELYQVETAKANEIQNLNARLFETENLLKARDVHQGEGLQQRIVELENMMRMREEDFHRIQMEKANEMDSLVKKNMELENLASCKTDEFNQMAAKLAHLEKSYNDSKIEIERLLNEENLNSEEKFVEPFQNNIQIPVAFELEAVTRSLEEEKQKAQNLQFELSDRDKTLLEKINEIQILENKIAELEAQLKNLADMEKRQRLMIDESYEVKAQLEKIVKDLQRELESSNLQLSETRRELEQYQNMEDETRSNLKSQLIELETALLESTEKKDSEILELKSLLEEKANFYESLLQSKREEETKRLENLNEVNSFRRDLEKEVERLRSELSVKENDITNLSQILTEERNQLRNLSEILQEKEGEVADLKQMLTHMKVEISSFRDFEKQVKELKMAQLREGSSDVSGTTEGDADVSGWTEHELIELSNKLQSDLDTALYMLHQRDVRCDELTFELMQLIEERDTLQLRLSTALRINEELRNLGKPEGSSSSFHGLQESKDLVDQSNDRQGEQPGVPGKDLEQLTNKISQLHSISYLRDKTVKDDSVQRHTEQMTLLSRISDSEIALSKDGQNSQVQGNWARRKAVPKVMHI